MNRNEVISGVVKQLAQKYSRKCWWVDERDLVQEGWLEVLTYNSEADMQDVSDADFRRYVYSAVSRKLSRFLWSQSSPASDSKPGKHLAGCRRAPLEALPVMSVAAVADEYDRGGHAKQMALRALLRRRLEASVTATAREARRAAETSQAGVQRVRRVPLDCVLMVVLEGREVVEAAKAKNVGWRSVQSCVNKFQVRMKSDPEIMGILNQLRELQA